MRVSNFQTLIPTRIIENLNFFYLNNIEKVNFPISTYETTLFASINRGVKVSQKHPISVLIISNNMTRSIVLQCHSIDKIIIIKNFLEEDKNNKFIHLQNIVNKTSQHCKLIDFNYKVVSNIIYLRCEFNTSEASGHNITTIAANEIGKFLQQKFEIKYLYNSGNTCCDKKVSAVNSIVGRGKNVIAEMIISRKTCQEILKTNPEKIVELNTKKNLIGSIVAGSICSANSHYANMLAGLYLPLGQDVANIVEGSQGITYCEILDNGDLYFSVNLTNIICGTIGNGKNIDFVKENFRLMHLIDDNNKLVNNSSEKLASIICCVVLCGELSLMSALTNQDELVKSHKLFERMQ